MVSGRALLIGISTRAMAESAVRAGHACVTIDRFGDLDQRRIAPGLALATDLGEPWSPARAAELAHAIDADCVAYGSNLENHPDTVAALARDRRLLGAGADTLQRVRDPFALREVLRAAGVRMPRTVGSGEHRPCEPSVRWLRKPRRSGGGGRIRDWRPGERLGPGEIGQEHVSGVAAAAVCVADGRRAVVLGLTRQLIGDARLGVSGFRYCGSVLPLARHPRVLELAAREVRRAARALTRELGLRGVFGIDFVLNRGGVHVLEVNPRFTASMELIERAYGLSMFGLHVRACLGRLPAIDRIDRGARERTLGKAVVFARAELELGDTRRWLDRDISDVPRPGARIAAGAPICTLFATSRTPEGCLRALRSRADALLAHVSSGRVPERRAR